MDLTQQPGFLPEMVGMIRTFDRDKHPGLVTGDRYHYKANTMMPCEDCGVLTNLVIDYLGKLGFCCGPHYE